MLTLINVVRNCLGAGLTFKSARRFTVEVMDAMRIGELSRRSGVPASTLRYYESEGLLPAGRTENGYRVYGPAAVDRLAFIAQAKHLDVPLPAVRELATAWESEPCRSVKARYRPMLIERAGQVVERMVELRSLGTALQSAIDRLDGLPDRDGPCETNCTFLDRPRGELLLAASETEPVACTLSGGDYTVRVQQWRDLLSGAPRTEVDGGVRVALPTSALERTAALAAAEQACCAFYRFRIDLDGPRFDLTITAPPEAADLLADLLPVEESTT
ncbi:MerR family transcriptional regulator [Promicromonospora xylanilytica]